MMKLLNERGGEMLVQLTERGHEWNGNNHFLGFELVVYVWSILRIRQRILMLGIN